MKTPSSPSKNLISCFNKSKFSFLSLYILLFFINNHFFTMADKTLLCTCVSCLKENPNGIQLNLNTYNRHRKRQQELSKKDEILEVIEQKENVKVFESQVEDVLYQEEFQTENILNQEEFQIAN